MQVSERPEPRALQRFVGIETVAKHAHGESHVVVTVTPNEVRERIEIAAEHFGNERRV
jgi:hypothetical protein